MEKEKINIAIIGAGAIARRAHLPAWKTIPDANVSCIVDVDQNLAQKVAAEFDVDRTTDDIQMVLDDSSIEILDVCTPTPTHHKIMLDAIEAGKHIICEKPLTSSLKDSIDIYNKYRENTEKRKISLIYNWRYQDNIREALNRRLGKKPVGDYISLHGTAFSHIPVGWTSNTWLYHESAVLYDFTPHLIDAVQWLVDKPAGTVFAHGKEFTENAKFLSSAQIIIKYENGPTAILDTSWEINSNQFNIDVYGNCGHLHIDFKRDNFFEFHGAMTPLDELRCFVKKMKNIANGIVRKNISTKMLLAYRPLFNNFIQAIKEDNESPMPIEREIWVGTILEAAKISIKEGNPISCRELLTNVRDLHKNS